MKKLSDNFVDTEFGDSISGEIPEVDPALLKGLEAVRAMANTFYPLSGRMRGVHITGPFRTKDHNAQIPGSAEASLHMTNPLQAVDLIIAGLTPMQALRCVFAVAEFGNGGVGLYPKDGHIHVDIGPQRYWIVE